jgi:hypothetical protein
MAPPGPPPRGASFDDLDPAVRKGAEICIQSAINSTIAFDGIQDRLIITNILGTAHAYISMRFFSMLRDTDYSLQAIRKYARPCRYIQVTLVTTYIPEKARRTAHPDYRVPGQVQPHLPDSQEGRRDVA